MISRRGGAIALAALVHGCTSPPAPPNVLLVVIDTLRADRLGAYGAARPTSPSIDALARQATVFENARSAGPWTVPAVASLLTGLYPSQHGNMGWLPGRRQPVLSADLLTLAEALRDRGYRTQVVSGHPWITPESGLTQGFEGFVSARARGAPVDDGRVTRGALDFLRSRAAAAAAGDHGPFFLYVHYMGAHSPYRPSPELQRAVLGRVAELTPLLRSLDGLRGPAYYDALNTAAREGRLDAADVACLSDLYDAAVRGADAEVGRLAAALRELGLDAGTLVVLTADHGESFLEHGTILHVQNLYDELLRVPLVVRWPGAGARRAPEPVSLVDVFATVLEAAGAPPAPSAGRSLRAPVDARRALFAEGDGTKRRVKVVRGGLAAIIDPGRPARDELYDLSGDPGERVDLAAARTSDLAALRRLALDFRAASARTRPAPSGEPLSPEALEALRALGYVQ